jgi:hypothetical protein
MVRSNLSTAVCCSSSIITFDIAGRASGSDAELSANAMIETFRAAMDSGVTTSRVSGGELS